MYIDMKIWIKGYQYIYCISADAHPWGERHKAAQSASHNHQWCNCILRAFLMPHAPFSVPLPFLSFISPSPCPSHRDLKWRKHVVTATHSASGDKIWYYPPKTGREKGSEKR
jgi:hypothetical protein